MKLTKNDAATVIEALIIQTTHIYAQAHKCTSAESKARMFKSHSDYLTLSIEFSRYSLLNDVIEVSECSEGMIRIALAFFTKTKEKRLKPPKRY